MSLDKNHINYVILLIEAGADLNIEINDFYTEKPISLFDYAIQKSNDKLANILLKREYDFSTSDNWRNPGPIEAPRHTPPMLH